MLFVLMLAKSQCTLSSTLQLFLFGMQYTLHHSAFVLLCNRNKSNIHIHTVDCTTIFLQHTNWNQVIVVQVKSISGLASRLTISRNWTTGNRFSTSSWFPYLSITEKAWTKNYSIFFLRQFFPLSLLDFAEKHPTHGCVSLYGWNTHSHTHRK